MNKTKMTLFEARQKIAYAHYEHRLWVRKELPKHPGLSAGDDKTDWEEAGKIMAYMDDTENYGTEQYIGYQGLFGEVLEAIER